MKKACLLLLIVALVVWLAASLRQPEPVTTLAGATMGTLYNVRIADAITPNELDQWKLRIQECLDGINARMSTYRADSEVSCFNRSTSTDWFPVSRDTALVVDAAQRVARETGGAFDITVGPLVNLWNFGPDRRPAGIPSDEEIEQERERVGYERLQVRLAPPALLKEIEQLTLDLSGIAKGFAVDRVGELLEEGGIEGYMVEVGGEVRTRGAKSNGEPWRIGVERPVVGKRVVESVLELRDNCLATSGDYRNVFQWEGQWYSHEIDPKTGRPVQHGVAAVSVMSESAMLADAFATGLIVMDPKQAWRLADQLELDIMIVIRAENEFERRVSRGFQQAIAEEVRRGAP